MLAEAARRAEVSVTFSVPTLDDAIWRRTEPATAHPRQRLRALKTLVDAGIRASVGMAPILPGLSDKPELLEQVVREAREAGACGVWANLLNLRPGTREHFLEALAQDFPEQLPLYERLYSGKAYLGAAETKPVRDSFASCRASTTSGTAAPPALHPARSRSSWPWHSTAPRARTACRAPPGAPSRRCAPAVDTSTSTTTVITYGSAWNSSGATVDAARLQRERQRREGAEEVRADEAERRPPEREDHERDRDPAGALRQPVHPLRRDREAEASRRRRRRTRRRRACARTGTATLIPIASAAAGDSPTARTFSPGRVRAR